MRTERRKKNKLAKLLVLVLLVVCIYGGINAIIAENSSGYEPSNSWRENAMVDEEPYANIKTIARKDENKLGVLVNKHFKLRDGFEPRVLVSSINGIMVTDDTKQALEKMYFDAADDGVIIAACSGYRSVEKQEYLYNKYKREYGYEYAEKSAARPGSSEHHTGRAIDLVSPNGAMEDFETTESYRWIMENMTDYGFILRYPKGYENITGYKFEPWHITYVGKDIAENMKKENIKTLEEYVGRYGI